MRFLTIVSVMAMALLWGTGAALAQEKAEVTEKLKTALAAAEGNEIIVKHYNVPPGWVTPKHYHSGHVVLYIEEGSGAMDIEGEVRQGQGGDVLQALPKEVMVMRNTSDSERLKFVVFQVNPEGSPYIVKAE